MVGSDLVARDVRSMLTVLLGALPTALSLWVFAFFIVVIIRPAATRTISFLEPNLIMSETKFRKGERDIAAELGCAKTPHGKAKPRIG